ncbi:hypothetical protein ACFO9E_13375 [Streptomyces maoxianensis]|uniref:Uncharacterized protein n=1 Tax=Streptomyces maoxianensis TaxID=1459942 RepID=A0ABV9G3A8_9ACTN
MTTDTIGHELAQYVSDALCRAVAKGTLTPEDLEAAKDAMRHGAVSVQRDEGGTFTVTVGAVAAVEGHISDLPSIASEWEVWFRGQ